MDDGAGIGPGRQVAVSPPGARQGVPASTLRRDCAGTIVKRAPIVALGGS